MALVGSFGVLLFRARKVPGLESEAAVLRGALIAIALVSAVSMPSQVPADALTVIVFMFWYTRLVDLKSLGKPLFGINGRLATVVAWGAAVVFAAYTFVIGRTELRPPLRAVRADWGYAYGLYDPEVIDGRTARWTKQNAVAVVEAPKRWLQLVFWANHRDIPTNPVDVKIWCNSQRVVRARLASATMNTVACRVPEPGKRIMLETHVDHVVRPRDFGVSDDRELGVALSWSFVDAPPVGAATVE